MTDDASAMRSFDQSLPMALLQAREATMRQFRPILAAHDLTEQQWRVLRALASIDEPQEVAKLAERTFLLGPSLSRILVNLEDRALISRETATYDQRRSIISLSRAGAALVGSVAPNSEAAYNDIEDQFGSRRLAELLAELRTLSEKLGQAS